MADFSAAAMPARRQWSNIFTERKRIVILEFFAWWIHLSKRKQKYFFRCTKAGWIHHQLEGNVKGSSSNRKKENDASRKSGSPQGIKSTRKVNYMLTKCKDF